MSLNALSLDKNDYLNDVNKAYSYRNLDAIQILLDWNKTGSVFFIPMNLLFKTDGSCTSAYVEHRGYS